MTKAAGRGCPADFLSSNSHSWHGEYYRIECEGGAAVLDRDHIVRIDERSAAGTLQTREVPPVAVIWEGHQAIAAQFLDWLYGDALRRGSRLRNRNDRRRAGDGASGFLPGVVGNPSRVLVSRTGVPPHLRSPTD